MTFEWLGLKVSIKIYYFRHFTAMLKNSQILTNTDFIHGRAHARGRSPCKAHRLADKSRHTIPMAKNVFYWSKVVLAHTPHALTASIFEAFKDPSPFHPRYDRRTSLLAFYNNGADSAEPVQPHPAGNVQGGCQAG